jgi:hypothetical protein
MKKIRVVVILVVFVFAMSLLSISLATAGGLQQSGGDGDNAAEIAADEAGNFPPAMPNSSGGLACPAGTVTTTLYFNDFEADDGGWVESGFGEWERGSIITGVHEFCDTSPRPEPDGPISGANVFATNLDGCYQNSGATSSLSQTFDLSAIPAPIQLSWWNWHEVFGTFDVIRVNINDTTLWEDTSSGATPDWLEEFVDLSPYAGNAAVEVEYELDATTVVNRSGWYLDDLAITYCAAPPPSAPSIALTKTVGLDNSTCATSSVLSVGQPSTEVYYCYEVANTGDVTLTTHDLVDDKLGPILTGFPYDLGPGEDVFVYPVTAVITSAVTNVATWTAYINTATFVTATASATVTESPTGVSLDTFTGGSNVITLPAMISLLALLVFAALFIIRRTQAGSQTE